MPDDKRDGEDATKELDILLRRALKEPGVEDVLDLYERAEATYRAATSSWPSPPEYSRNSTID